MIVKFLHFDESQSNGNYIFVNFEFWNWWRRRNYSLLNCRLSFRRTFFRLNFEVVSVKYYNFYEFKITAIDFMKTQNLISKSLFKITVSLNWNMLLTFQNFHESRWKIKHILGKVEFIISILKRNYHFIWNSC